MLKGIVCQWKLEIIIITMEQLRKVVNSKDEMYNIPCYHTQNMLNAVSHTKLVVVSLGKEERSYDHAPPSNIVDGLLRELSDDKEENFGTSKVLAYSVSKSSSWNASDKKTKN